MSGISVNTKKIVIASFIIVTLFAVAYIKNNYFEGCQTIGCIDFKGIREFELEEIYEDQNDSFRASYSSLVSKLRVDIKANITQEEAKKETDVRLTNMKKIFEKERAPYPGEISDTIECDDKFIPKWSEKEVEGQKIQYARAYLNDRLVYGACTDEQIKNQGLMVLFYCPNQKKLYQLEIINSQDKPGESEDTDTSLVDSIRCLE